jgi:hypothetical protein
MRTVQVADWNWGLADARGEIAQVVAGCFSKSEFPEIHCLFSLPTIVSTTNLMRTIAIISDALVIYKTDPAKFVMALPAGHLPKDRSQLYHTL